MQIFVDRLCLVGIVVNREPQLLEVVRRLHSRGRFPHFLNGREQHADEDGDDAMTTRSSMRVNPFERRDIESSYAGAMSVGRAEQP